MNARAWYFLCLSLLLSLGNSPSYAQLSIAEFLQSAKSAYELTTFEEQIRYLETKPYRLSPLRQMEFRTKNNQLDPSRQDYGVRFSPANPWEIKNNSNYFKQYKTVLSLEKELALKEALITRYTFVAELLYFQELRTLKEEDNRLVTTQLSILEKQSNSDFFNGEDYLELKLDQMDKTVELEEASFDLDNQIRKMSGIYPEVSNNRLKWQYKDILSVDRIQKITDSLLAVHSTPVTLTYRENKINLADQEYLLEKSNINLGFLQTTYEEYRTEQDRRPWSISLGVTIPVTNPNKGDMTKRRLDAIEAVHDRDEAKAELQTERALSYEQLKSLINRYHDIQDKINEVNVSTLSSTLKAIKDDNPMVALRFNGNLLKLRSIEIKLKHSIVLTYIEFLGRTDNIQQQPLLNYFSPYLETIGL
ncbi:MAG: hypothetical protein C0490_00975 [Marivirga sp.]|nr:hypothetical protein [Marivirga sp.]